MASNVTHYFFAREMMNRLPEEAQNVVQKYPKQFIIGNQGPDIFFYHMTSKNHKVGSYIHGRPFDHLLLLNRPWLQKKPVDSPTWSYFLGLLCHFSLDIAFHPYIDGIERSLEIDHITMEREMDRHLLQKAGYTFGEFSEIEAIPHPKYVADDILPVYAPYSDISIHDIRRSLYSFRIAMNFFHVNSKSEYRIKRELLRQMGLFRPFGGMLMNPDGFYEAEQITTPALEERMELAYSIARDAIEGIYGDEKDFPDFFHLNFNGQ